MAPIIRLTAALLVGTSLTACKKEAPGYSAPPGDRPVPKFSWLDNGKTKKLKVEQDDLTVQPTCCRYDDGGRMSAVISDGYPRLLGGSIDTVEWKSKRNGGPFAPIGVDIREHFASMPLDRIEISANRSATAEMEVSIPITVKFERQALLETRFEGKMQVEEGIAGLMRLAAKEPVVFADEPKEGPVDAAIMLWGPARFTIHRKGDARQVRDIDWVAMYTWVPTGKTRKCSGYRAMGEVIGTTLEFRLGETRVDLYQRRTGEKVAEKTFAPMGCPQLATTGGAETNERSIGGDSRAMLRWLDASVKAGKPLK